MKSITIITSVR